MMKINTQMMITTNINNIEFTPYKLSYLSKSITVGEQIPNQKVYLAQALYKDGRKVEAVKYLKEVANMEPSVDDRVRDWEQIGIADELLKDFKSETTTMNYIK